jgi:aminopeptidase N
MTLEALRERVGDTLFYRIMRAYVRLHGHGHARTAQFEALAEHESHRNLRAFFRAWLYAAGKPRLW